MHVKPNVTLVGGGIGSLAAAAFPIRDRGVPGNHISILEALPVFGGSLDAAGDPGNGYSLRGGRMMSVQVLWGYGLFPHHVGNCVPKPMADCNGSEILDELAGHFRFDIDTPATANCIPCRIPYITDVFMPRRRGDRLLPVPRGSRNLALISQYVEIADDVVFTVEYSVRAAQIEVYQLLGGNREIPRISPKEKSLKTQFETLVKAFK